MKRLKPIEITVGALFVCLMAIGANITVWFPFLAIPIGGATVPLSLQTFFAILAGLMLGKRLGSFAMITYILVGIVGVPVFAGMKAGPMQLATPTGGFIISFVFIALLSGWLVERHRNPTVPTYVLASCLGLAANYVIGVSLMYLAMNTWLELEISYVTAWAGMIPFLIKDIALSFLAGIFAVRIANRIPMNWKTAKAS
ncbi:biotin transporter BioY [Ornithinibacillus scapharcae]|uniref:biotin transporter BioY n=1 Tax=Ornithinibacillus scapharcae TaxID=1147159 RepID=UPI000225B313|nr:biotin transporter BioY [Ornithinibacillus scapharcae]